MKLSLKFKIEVDVETPGEAAQRIAAALADVATWSNEIIADGAGVIASAPLPRGCGENIGIMNMSLTMGGDS